MVEGITSKKGFRQDYRLRQVIVPSPVLFFRVDVLNTGRKPRPEEPLVHAFHRYAEEVSHSASKEDTTVTRFSSWPYLPIIRGSTG